MGVETGDYDNDGNEDLYVTGYPRNRLYHNNGNCTFKDVTGGTTSSTAAAFGSCRPTHSLMRLRTLLPTEDSMAPAGARWCLLLGQRNSIRTRAGESTGNPSRFAGLKCICFAVWIAASSRPWPRPLTTRVTCTWPDARKTTSSTTSPSILRVRPSLE